MRNCKQVISMILVLAMLFAVVSVGMVQGAAAVRIKTTILIIEIILRIRSNSR